MRATAIRRTTSHRLWGNHSSRLYAGLDQQLPSPEPCSQVFDRGLSCMSQDQRSTRRLAGNTGHGPLTPANVNGGGYAEHPGPRLKHLTVRSAGQGNEVTLISKTWHLFTTIRASENAISSSGNTLFNLFISLTFYRHVNVVTRELPAKACHHHRLTSPMEHLAPHIGSTPPAMVPCISAPISLRCCREGGMRTHFLLYF